MCNIAGPKGCAGQDECVFGDCPDARLHPPETMALIPCLLPFQDALISLLRRSRLHFIHCLVPTTVESKAGQRTPSPSQPSGDQGVANEPTALDIPALRVQLAGSHILEALRLHRAGRRQLGTENLVLRTPIVCQAAIGHEHSLFLGTQRTGTPTMCPRQVASVCHFTDGATEVQNADRILSVTLREQGRA
jgi:hypothetical protein